MTLVELLVTISIIGILMSAMLLAMAAASEAAAEAKTRTTIAKLNALLMAQWDTYRTRRVPVDTSGVPREAAMLMRLNGIRVLMQMDFPERWIEIESPPPSGFTRTAFSASYFRRFTQLRSQDPNWPTDQYQGAECLYLIITTATGDGEALSHFAQHDVGDFDGDGAPEFLDGWGNPISFLRWTPGFVSELQPLMEAGSHPLDDREFTERHDPFDPFLLQPKAFAMYPLIYSAGPDEVFDVRTDFATPSYPMDGPGNILNPYSPNTVPPGEYPIGFQRDRDNDGEQFHDNIHNHLIGLR